ncbi:RNA-directed DNA polymerase, eukaryota, reverse transcriptase zinc-binding domain protein, partial [Tanacetum coccineum]
RCRVLIGWDSERIQGGIVHASDQAVLCLFEMQSSKQRLFCTFIHAEISGKLRKKLWTDLCNYKSMINDNQWVIMGDFNVSLNPEDHYEGISYMTQDMEEFRDCIDFINMEDLCSSGLHYTWIKSLLNPNNRIMKKIDRVMGNEEFFEKHTRAHVVFANYVADKEEFQGVVKDKWKTQVEGFALFKLVKMLKEMKPIMNKLNWKDGNLFEKVKKLKISLDEIQTRIEVDPNNVTLREQGVSLFKEYTLALEDEEKLLLQKTKVEWLKEGDKNSAYFRKKFLEEQNNMECLDLDGSLFSNKIETQEACKMITEVSNMEIKEAMVDINDNKAPGPDGFTKFLEKALRLFGFHTKMIQWIMMCVTTPSYTICLYGERRGFFKGGRGLRQGDPLSPYLFTLVMEIVLCHGDVNSVSVIKNALDKFSSVSRTQLIALVLSFIQVYWAYVFKLPKVVIDDIEKIFKGFLWNKGELQKGKAKVAWKEVCQPKQNGGLALKPLESWNYAFLSFHVPMINNDVEDILVWRTNNGILKPFSTNQAWKDIRTLNGHVQWWKVIWFSQNIPSHAFVL